MGNRDILLDIETVQDIFDSCAKLVPCLKDTTKTKVLGHNSGLQSARVRD